MIWISVDVEYNTYHSHLLIVQFPFTCSILWQEIKINNPEVSMWIDVVKEENNGLQVHTQEHAYFSSLPSLHSSP